MPKLARYPNLDRRITIQNRDKNRGIGGGLVATWTDVEANIPAARQDEPGTRYDTIIAGSQVNNLLRTYFTVRWTVARASMDGSERIIHEGKIFALHGQPIEVGPRKTYLQIFAQAGAEKL